MSQWMLVPLKCVYVTVDASPFKMCVDVTEDACPFKVCVDVTVDASPFELCEWLSWQMLIPLICVCGCGYL